MINRKQLAMNALMAAIKLREENNVSVTDPINVFDFTTDVVNISVQFVDYPSMEAMYLKKQGSKPRILISSLRPSGRQVFNCAHELGHHVFGHGTKIDEYIEGNNRNRNFDPEEYLANTFASFFLMPKTLVEYAFQVRGWVPQNCSPYQIYSVSNWLSVGYSTLINHLRWSLKLISPRKEKDLLQIKPKIIRSKILGYPAKENLTIVDYRWQNRAIDVEVGDFILLPAGINFEGNCVCLVEQDSNMNLYNGKSPGKGRFVHSENGWSSYVRVRKRNYVGFSKYRYIKDPDYDNG